MLNPKSIVLTAESLKYFKAAYKKAAADGLDTFVFDGNTFVVSYAKYFIEYIEGQLNGR